MVKPTRKWMVPWLMQPAPDHEDLEVYYDSVPAGVYQHRPGQVCWTDGSQRSILKLGAVAGAGFVENKGGRMASRVGGRPTAMRAELAAATLAVKDTRPNEELTVITDSMSLLWILRRWRRQDFGFWIDQELHDYILTDLLAAIRRRTARTTFVWCKAHAGDLGNEQADIMAGEGCWDEDPPVWDRDKQATVIQHRLCGDRVGDVVSWDGWSRKATKTGVVYIQNNLRDYMAATLTAISTLSLVKEGRGRKWLGEALASEEVPQRAKRDMLQARSFAFPTAAIVARNSRGLKSAECIYCGHHKETFGHFQCECTAFDGARRHAHDTIAEVLIEDLGQHHPTAVTMMDKAMRKLFPDCDDLVKDLRPDGLIVSHERKYIYLIEFTRGMSEETEDQLGRLEEKVMKYHIIRLFLRHRYLGYVIKQGTFIMGVLTSIDEGRWKSAMTEMGMPEKVQVDTMR